jgi:hypothetical protein
MTVRRQAGASPHDHFLETTKVNEGTRTKLRGVSTATLASALYKRGLRNQMVQDVRPLATPKNGSMGRSVYAALYPSAGRPEPDDGVSRPQSPSAPSG